MHTSLKYALANCKPTVSLANAPINGGGRNMATFIKYWSKSEIGGVIRLLDADGNDNSPTRIHNEFQIILRKSR